MFYKESSNNVDFPLLFKRSTDGGASFGKAIKLAEAVDYTSRVAAVGTNVYIVWQSFSPQGIFFIRSVDSGVSFEKPIKLGKIPLELNTPDIAVYGKSTVYVAWREESPGEDDIFFARSIDGGKSFGNTINLSNNAGSSANPRLAVASNGNNVYAVWDDRTTQSGLEDVFFRRSSNGGTSFDNTINLSNNAATSGGSLVVAASSGVVANDNVYVAWSDATLSDDEILYRRSTNGGTSFDNTINLSNDATASWFPVAVAYGDNHFYIAWTSWQDHEILYKRSVNGGTSFGNTINLSNDPGKSAYARIAVSSNNNVNVLWADNTPGNEDVFFRKSSSGGAGFGCTLNLSDSNSDGVGRIDLAIVSGGNNIFTTWMADAAPNNDIYFRTSPPPVPVP